MVVLLSLSTATRIRNYDIFWHLANGRWIVENGAVPRWDPFSFTFRDQPCLSVPWLGDLVIYCTFLTHGVAALVVLKAVLTAATLLLMVLVARILTPRATVPFMVLPFVVVVAQPRLDHVRPEIIGFVLLSLSVYLGIRFWLRRDHIWIVLPVVTLLWLQIHASAVLAVAISTLLLLSIVLLRAPRRDWLQAGGVALGSGAVLLLTRAGRELVWLGRLASPQSSPITNARTTEWQPPDLSSGDLWIPMLVVGGAAIWALRDLRRTLFPLLLAGLGAFMASRSNRHVGPAAVLCTPLLILGASALVDALQPRVSILLRTSVIALAILGLPLAHLVVSPMRESRIGFGFSVDQTRFPIETTDTLLKLPPGRTMNDYALGGYLIWRRIPEGVFWDGRNVSLYPDSWYREIVEGSGSSTALEAMADRWNIAYGIGPHDMVLGSAMMQSPYWIPVHHGKAATLFVRRKELERLRASGVAPLMLLRGQANLGWMQQWYEPIFRDPRLAQELENEIVYAAGMTPDSPVLELVLDWLSEANPDMHHRVLDRIGH